jgi:hypothetical protein
MQIAVIGLDLAKNVFQVHGIDDSGQAAVKRKFRRSEVLPFFAGLAPALIGIEACHTAHYWGREIAALGHDVRLMPPQFVKPYVKSQKNDAADAEARMRRSSGDGASCAIGLLRSASFSPGKRGSKLRVANSAGSFETRRAADGPSASPGAKLVRNAPGGPSGSRPGVHRVEPQDGAAAEIAGAGARRRPRSSGRTLGRGLGLSRTD